MVFQPYNRNALIKWYDENAANYDDLSYKQDQASYGGDAYRIVLVKKLLDGLGIKDVLDVGCGTGSPMLALLEGGIDARGFDLSPGMITEAKAKLKKAGRSEDLARVADILDMNSLGELGKRQYQAVVANGVLPYIEDVDTAHKNLTSLVKPGGYYISAYSNELFDMTTFNRFTMRFHERNFIDPLEMPAEAKDALKQKLRSMVTNPDLPASIPEGGRDEIFVRGHNPLTIPDELKRYGLSVEDMVFYKFHAFAPLLKGSTDAERAKFIELSRSYEVNRARDWRGYFLASTFIIVAKKAN
jgi:2-polyprenyl-3-methyl-5-hydroxy-6-metoxy-1,4-benzoquinol methylase